MAELVLPGLLSVFFERLTSATMKSIARYKGIDAEIKRWKKTLISIQLYLTHASQLEITNPAMKQQLNDLQHLAYDIDDVLDGWLTEVMHPEFIHESEGMITGKVRKLIPTCCTNVSRTAAVIAELDDISTELQNLVKNTNLGWKVEEGARPRNNNNNKRRYEAALVDPSHIVGRQAEKDALVQQLLLPAEEPCDQNYSIVPIHGMGGVGKTTLARLLYNEKQVKDHFELRAWVSVSDVFDSFAISRVIFQSVTGVNKKFADLNLLQEDLVNHLTGKRFLLVLDDVWSESYADWETLVRPFFTCATGTKVIITTRKDQLVKQLVHNPLNKQLHNLSDEDALSLFARHSLGVNNFNSHVSQKPYAESIVKKCGGLPLALITLGRLLRTKRDEVEHWKEVSNSDIWRLKDGDRILPALRLSYDDLSAPLKKLFAYCSLFPKDFLFDREELVLLWMAEGFLDQPTQIDSTEEQHRWGHEFFDELLSRSFFQHAPNNESLFVMHDLMNDLATSVSTEFFIRLDNESDKNIRTELLEKYRHMSFIREHYVAYKKFEEFERARNLRTFLAASVGEAESWWRFNLSNKILIDLLPKLPLLRVLYLSGFKIKELPDSIGTLRHLRYVNLSQTSITHLPEKVCNLYNLQTLLLFGCYALTKLPNNFLKLKNLRHLDVRDTPLVYQMLLGVGELKNLQITLSNIIIGSESGSEIAKLKEFTNLSRKISIIGLEKVQKMIANEVNFSQIKLSELELVWSDEQYYPRNGMLEKQVLAELKPYHDTLIQLKIRSYGGLDFPNWVGDPLFRNLKQVSISSCMRCTSLPPLGQLPSLTKLIIDGLYGVEVVGFELFGTDHAFPSLEVLCFKNMLGWKKWFGAVFPCLQMLEIENSPNLVEVTLEGLPSLNVLKLNACDSSVLKRLVEIPLAVTKLIISHISRLNDVVWGGIIEYLGAVEELCILYANEISYLVKSDAVASMVLVKLKKLKVRNCDNLVSLGEKDNDDNCRSNILTSLRILKVYYCKNMELCSCPDGVEELTVWDCSSVTLVSFPKGGQEKLKSLEIIHCGKLLERGWGGQKIDNTRGSMPMLEYLHITDWPNLKSVIELNCLVHLMTLSISDCQSLESFPDNLISLKTLTIRNCPRIDAPFPSGVWPPNLRSLEIGMLKKPLPEWGPQKFPSSLVELELIGDKEDRVHSCNQISNLLPLSLTSLEIVSFHKLESVSTGLQHLTSLQHLSIIICSNLKEVWHPHHLTSLKHLYFQDCHNLMDLPELSPSLCSLRVQGCQHLKERYSENRSHWPLISHIPDVDIS